MGRIGEIAIENRIQAVFLDRDGVINQYLPQRYVETPEQLVILPGVAESIKRLNDAGVLVIVISNQQGVARGIMTLEALDKVTEEMHRIFALSGAHVNQVYYCPHHKNDGCICRKPKPGMIEWAVRDYGIDLNRAVFVGDSATDMEAAHAAGISKRFFVLTGAMSSYELGSFKSEPTRIFKDLPSVADWVLSE